MNTEIWVLSDNIPGNANQAIALAEETDLDYQIKNIKYNILGALPNTFLQYSPLHIKRSIIRSLKNEEFPKIIISSGRRTAPLAVFLKKHFSNQPKVIQIMRPGMELDDFDLIVLPQHDNVNQSSPKIVKIIGALSSSARKMETAGKELELNYPEAKDFIGVMIGGNNKRYKFSESSINTLCSKLKIITDNHLTPFFFSFSRRTPENLKQIIIKKFLRPHIVYDPKNNRPNPYLGILAHAKFVICTGDSISMCSEIATTGKPLYIYCPQDFELKKHRFFIQQLCDIGVAKKFDNNTNFLEDYSYTPLNEVKKVANIVRLEFFSEFNQSQ